MADDRSGHPWRRVLADLKRRQVFKIAALYGAAGFAVVQAADVFVPALRLPPAITTGIALVVVLGFPVALVIAWAFEVTPEGVKRTEGARPGELEAIAAERAYNRWPIGLAALVGVVLIGLSAWWLLSGRIGEGRTYESIAVLPLVNLSGNPDFDYFGDGLAEELLNALAGIENLRVAARTSAFAFEGRDVDVRTIGDSLGVQTVLEGSVGRYLNPRDGHSARRRIPRSSDEIPQTRRRRPPDPPARPGRQRVRLDGRRGDLVPAARRRARPRPRHDRYGRRLLRVG